jgi:uncharacterized protein with NRDE domain
MRLLGDRTPASEAEVPRTGLTLEWEILLSPIFIAAPEYGTRSSTVMLVDHHRRVYMAEQNWIHFSQSEYRLSWSAVGGAVRKGLEPAQATDE